jgi:glucose/arabinose dehydrogenase/mono/diheme cytochrome c family protein
MLALLAAASPLFAAAPKVAKASALPSLPTWVEPDFPFFSSVLDARKAGAGLPADNLAPRSLVLNLGRDLWAAFDPDLLRMTAIWRGAGVTPTALAPGSYHDISRKTPAGQVGLPRPDGRVWIATGTYPGWQIGTAVSLTDPREPAPSSEEVGRGPLPTALGRFNALRLVGDGAVLDYTVGSTRVQEWLTTAEGETQPVVERHFEVAGSADTLHLVLGTKPAATALALGVAPDSAAGLALVTTAGVATVRVPARRRPVTFTVAFTQGTRAAAPRATLPPRPTGAPARRWPQEVVTSLYPSGHLAAYVVDHLGLPEDNPWRRAVRPCDIQFFRDGTGALVTIDGDVWLARGAHEASGKIHWRRFASGLHEPMSLAIRDEELFAFDRNGLWRLRDTNGDGEADVYEMFSNAFAQTADMREFPSQVRLGPRGEFVIAKGGQQATTQGKHNGSVLRITADGKNATVLGYGFRQPNLAVNLRTGLVTASDQQGQYIPSTPLLIVRDAQFYGFLAPFAPKEKYPAPIADPLTWIPHPVNASGLSQVWLYGARLGPINDELVHIGYNRPELFRVLFNSRGSRPQAAVVSLTRAFEYPPLNGSVNPADGLLYIAGFQVIGWGNIIDVPAGLGRVRYTGAPVTLPREVVPTDQGVLLRFEVALDPTRARNPANYSLQSWAYQRTYKYGSAQYKADGTPGQDALTASAAYLAPDGRSVFVAVPGMKPVMQLRVGWSLATAAGQRFDENAYTTPYELAKFDPKAEGFGDITVDLTPRPVVAQAAGPVSAEEGSRLAQMFGCIACHGSDQGAAVARSGPPWKGLYGTSRTVFVGGQARKVTADEVYLRESILDPTAKVAGGFEKGEYAMASFAGVLTDSQIDSLILYIKGLK